MNKRIYLTFQQSELDAVKMYQALADRAPEESERQKLLQLGAVEGRHAAILSKITGVHDLRPTDSMAKLLCRIDDLVGRKGTYLLLAAGEYGASWLYKPLARVQSTLIEVGKQEAEHAVELLRLIQSLPRAKADLPLRILQR